MSAITLCLSSTKDCNSRFFFIYPFFFFVSPLMWLRCLSSTKDCSSRVFFFFLALSSFVFLLWCDYGASPPAPMNHVKYLSAGPAEMPFRNWYTANTNHFHLTDSVRWKWKTVEMKNPTRLSNKTSNAWSCAEDQILENKNLQNMILNICTER